MVISNNRIPERSPYLEPIQRQHVSDLQYLFPTLRQGLYQYFKSQKFLSVLLPDYVPEGIYHPFKALGFHIYFYHIYDDFSIDLTSISHLLVSHKIEVLVYIHYFGIYHEKNISSLKRIVSSRIVFLEDFAHTIYSKDIPISGDIALYSFTKMFGVSEGSLMWFRNRDLFVQHEYLPADKAAKLLSTKFRASFHLESFLARWTFFPFLDKCVLYVIGKLNKIIGNRPDNLYYDYLIRNYSEIACKMSDKSIAILNHLDFKEVVRRRKELCRLYLDGLDDSFLFAVPRSYYTSQALYAFPIQVRQSDLFDKHLIKNGIRPLRHTALWWFTDESKQGHVFSHHRLLPMNHYLSDAQIQKVISVANEFYRKRLV